MPLPLLIAFIIACVTSAVGTTVSIVKLLQSPTATPMQKALGILQTAASNFIGLLGLPNSPIPAGAAATALAWTQMANQALGVVGGELGITPAQANQLVAQVGASHGWMPATNGASTVVTGATQVVEPVLMAAPPPTTTATAGK